MRATSYLIIGAKGGCGASTFSVDLAKAVRRASKAAVVVDADLSGRRAIAELLNATRALDAGRVDGVHAVANASGIDVVELVANYEDVAALRAAELEACAAHVFDVDGFVIVDVPRPLEHYVAPFVRRGMRAMIVAEPDVLGASAARTMVRNLTRFGFPLDRLQIVLIDRAKKSSIEARELEKLVGVTVIAELPRNTDRRPYERALDAIVARMTSAPDEAPFLRLPSLARFASVEATSRSRRRSDLAVLQLASGESETVCSAAADEAQLHRRDKRDRVRREINEAMMSRVDLVAASTSHSDGQKFAELRKSIDGFIDEIVASRTDINDLTLQDRAEIKQEILDEQLGLGPLEDLMRDPTVSEIMVNGPKKIFVERAGKVTLSDRVFANERHLRVVIERIVAPLGRRIDEASPMVDARLADGSRVNAIIEPLALHGSTLTIRRFGKERLSIDDLVRFGTIPEEVVPVLRALTESRHNIIVSGGTGTGKTTFLNVLSRFIPGDERIVTIEDSAELSLGQENVVGLEARPQNIEGRGQVTIRELVRNSLRMRPDRIVVGECRGGEALDMLQAMNSGHDGSLTTLHANTARDAVARLETLVLMAGFELPVRAIREQIVSAIDIIVQIDRMRDGTRKVISISEVVGMRDGHVQLQDIVRFQQRGLDGDGRVLGAFQYMAVKPRFLVRCEEMGVPVDIGALSKLEKPLAIASSKTR